MPAVTPATRLPLHSDGTAAVSASKSTGSGAGGCQRDQQIIRQRRPVAALELTGLYATHAVDNTCNTTFPAEPAAASTDGR